MHPARHQDAHKRASWLRGFMGMLILTTFIFALTGGLAWGMFKGATVVLTQHPTPGFEEAILPLGSPPRMAHGEWGYSFMETQDDDYTKPAAWDPCRPIHYVTSGKAPKGFENLIDSAVGTVSAATGLKFIDDGATSEQPTTASRPSFLPEYYGDRWAPVLFAWTSPDVIPALSGPALALGAPQVFQHDGSQLTIVSGTMYLDTPELRNFSAISYSGSPVTGVILHELGHAMGLGHVSASSELMNPVLRPGFYHYGKGDLRGLAVLGQGPCAPQL